MITIKDLKIMNYTQIECLKQMNKDITRNLIIKQILKDEECFSKLKKEDAYIVLNDIGISNEQIENVYRNLTLKKE